MEYERHEHGFGPVWDANSRVLILGSFPSVKSRAGQFYYMHPQNRFWPLLSLLFGDEPGNSARERRDFALRHKVALWDVIESCEIKGSSDSSIRGAVVTDLDRILKNAPIENIYCNGQTAGKLYQRYQQGATGKEAATLPSTSPANAAWTLKRLAEAWGVILETEDY